MHSTSPLTHGHSILGRVIMHILSHHATLQDCSPMKAQRWYLHSLKQFTPLYGSLFFECDVDFEFGSTSFVADKKSEIKHRTDFFIHALKGASNVRAALCFEGITLMEKQEDGTYSQYKISYVSCE